MSVGERLKKLRLNTKKTLKEESEIFDISLNSIYRWEHDLCVPRKSVLKKIAEFYGVPFEWLLNGGGKEENLKCDSCILNPENNTEQKILKMIKKLSENNKYKILGYIERMSVEGENEENI